MKRIASFIILIIAIVACEDIYEAPPQALLEVNVQNSNPNATRVPKVSVYGVEQDSIWIYQEQTQNFRLPLRPHEYSSFVLLLDSIADTLTVHHETIFKYGSLESGFYNEHWINEIENTFHRIDSVVVVDSAVTKNWHENIKLYIGPIPASNIN
ncbi:DUF6452 family protein [Sunxiuqinia sp. A32]|uniref:DUF6452 family protein n=1 Tax=Sunxiuqinia sp. A32 TaxID=3461496 RepID=UPI0040460DD2